MLSWPEWGQKVSSPNETEHFYATSICNRTPIGFEVILFPKPLLSATGWSVFNVFINHRIVAGLVVADCVEELEENRRLREARMCKVCMDNEVNTVFLPCGHLVCCDTCSPALRNCAVCRAVIRGTVKVFLGWAVCSPLFHVLLCLFRSSILANLSTFLCTS